MKSNFVNYDFPKSIERITEILNTSDTNFDEVDEIPSRDKLTFTNGFYVNYTSSLFIDIRQSSSLPSKYKRPTLARIYRGYISEAVAIINGNEDCAEINIVGDSVWGVFNARYKTQIDKVFQTAYTLSSMIDILNCKLKKKNIDPIEVGIGIDFGRVLMIKAGYFGSGLNDVVWMGEVVNNASKLCGYGNQTSSDNEIMVSNTIFDNLNVHNQKLLKKNYSRNCYHGNVIRTDMQDWLTENCK